MSEAAFLRDEGLGAPRQRIQRQRGREGAGPITPAAEFLKVGGHVRGDEGKAVTNQQRDEGMGSGEEDTDQLLGLPVRRVRLFLLGGLSEIARTPRRPAHEGVVAAAGPAVSVALAGLCWLILLVIPSGGPIWLLVLQCAFANTAVGVISPKYGETFHYSLPAGKYLIRCYWPDDDTGMPHAFMGMWKLIWLK